MSRHAGDLLNFQNTLSRDALPLRHSRGRNAERGRELSAATSLRLEIFLKRLHLSRT